MLSQPVTRLICVCGARPNFMKVAPIVEALAQRPAVETHLVHTGQHYDEQMSRLFFEELRLPKPDLNLEVGSGTQASQTAEVMKRFEPVCVELRPHWVIVVGDVNSTLAAALVAAKLGIKVAHVEAGLRSFDRSMPEEINRILTDALSDLLFVSEPSGVENLRREGAAEDRIHLVGNVMVDTLLKHRAQAEQSGVLVTLGLKPRQYAVVTLHRPDNVDRAEVFREVIRALQTISTEMPVVFPVHPRTMKRLAAGELPAPLDRFPGLRIIKPLGYMDFVKLTANSSLVMTDSGGIQEETTVLGVPCLTLRDNTERPITISEGTNRLVGRSYVRILEAFHEVRAHPIQARRVPECWDGRAAERVVARLLDAN